MDDGNERTGTISKWYRILQKKSLNEIMRGRMTPRGGGSHQGPSCFLVVVVEEEFGGV